MDPREKMVEIGWRLFGPTEVEGEEQRSVARMLCLILPGIVLGLILVLFLLSHQNLGQTIAILGGLSATGVALILTRRGRIRAAFFLVLASMLAMTTTVMATGLGIHDITIILFPGLIVIASIILRRWGFALFTLLAIAAISGIALAEMGGLLTPPPSRLTSPTDLVSIIVILLITALAVRQLANNFRTGIAKAQESQRVIAKQETLYRLLVETSPDGIVVIDPNGTLTAGNQRIASMLGVEKIEEVIGRNAFDFIIPNDRSRAMFDFDKLIREGGTKNSEYWFIKKDGGLFAGEINASPIPEPNRPPLSLMAIVRDTSVRRTAEEALRISERKYRQLVDNSLVGIYIIQDQAIRFCNQHLAELFGARRPEEIMGMPLQKLVAPESWPSVEAEVRLREGGEFEANRYRFTCVRTDGQRFHVEALDSRILHGGRPAIQGIMVDVTKRHLAEKGLQERGEQLRNIVEHSSNLFYSHNPDHVLTYVSPRSREILDCEPQEAMIRWTEFLTDHPKNAEGIRLTQLAIDTGQRQPPYELELYTHRGRRIWVEVNESPVVRDGRTVSMVGSLTDITERKRSEETLRESEERFRRLAEAPFEGIAISEKGRIVEVNRMLAEMLGWTQAEMVGKEVSEFVAPEDLECVFTHIQSDSEEAYEHLARRRDGSLFPVEARGKALHFRGRSLRITALKDMTSIKCTEEERQRLEMQVRQMQKLESLGTLASGIAHDFNNILSIVLGYATFLSSQYKLQKPVSAKIGMIREAAERGASLVKQILAFAHKENPSLNAVDLKALISDLAQMLRETFPKTMEIVLDCDPALPTLALDAVQVHQALLNLAINARDAMAGKGRLTIGTSLISGSPLALRFPIAKGKRWVLVRVADTGPGMTADVKRRLFEPFFTTKDQGLGNGLGLSVVYGVMQAHSGFVDVETAPDQGSVFTLYFPLSPIVEKAKKKKPQARPTAGGSETILVVEDEEGLRELLANILETAGYGVLTAADGQQALELYRSPPRPVDVVITDMDLPQQNGLELSRKLREIQPDVKIILYSGYLDDKVKSSLYGLGVRELIAKPYQPSEILAALHRILNLGSPGSPSAPDTPKNE